MATGSTKAVYAALFGNLGIEVNLVDGLYTDIIETITDVIENEIMTIMPSSKKEYIFVKIQQ